MSITMDEEIKRWTAKRKTALVMDIIQGKTTVSEAARAFDLAPSEIEEWVNDAKQGMENALRAKPLRALISLLPSITRELGKERDWAITLFHRQSERWTNVNTVSVFLQTE